MGGLVEAALLCYAVLCSVEWSGMACLQGQTAQRVHLSRTHKYPVRFGGLYPAVQAPAMREALGSTLRLPGRHLHPPTSPVPEPLPPNTTLPHPTPPCMECCICSHAKGVRRRWTQDIMQGLAWFSNSYHAKRELLAASLLCLDKLVVRLTDRSRKSQVIGCSRTFSLAAKTAKKFLFSCTTATPTSVQTGLSLTC